MKNIKKMKKDLEKKQNNNGKLLILYFLGFIIAMVAAIPAYSQSSFLDSKVGMPLVSTFFLLANILTFFSILFYPKIIKKIKNFRSARRVIIFYAISLVGLTLAPNNPWLMFTFFGLMNACISLIAINMDVFVESFCSNSSSGRIHMAYFTAVNLGWIVSPFIAGILIQSGGYKITYAASLICLMIFSFFLISQEKKLEDKNIYYSQNLFKTLKNIAKRKDLKSIFFLSFLLSVFFSLAVIFLPVYLNQVIGFGWETLGIMFSIMLIPFVLISMPAGIIADKYIGEKELLILGFIILSVSLILFSYVSSASFWLWTGILFLSRVGATLIESMRESYFFKVVDAHDVDYINFFRAMSPLGYVFGTALGSIVLCSLSINHLFQIGAFLMCLAFPVLFYLKDSK